MRTFIYLGALLICASFPAQSKSNGCALLTGDFYVDASVEMVAACLVENGEASINKQDSNNGNTPLHFALMHSPDTKVIRLLLSNGANLQTVNADGRAPVHSLAEHGSVPSHVAALKAAGADVNLFASDDVCKLGNCSTIALHRVAARPDAIGLLRAFLAAGADVDQKDPAGRIALHIAARQSGWEAVEMLVAAGSEINAKDFRNDTPLHLAAQRGPDENLPAAADATIVQLILLYGADANIKNDAEQFPLMPASIYSDDIDIWKMLLFATDPDLLCAEDEKGRTVKALFDLNSHLTRDSDYWHLNQRCP